MARQSGHMQVLQQADDALLSLSLSLSDTHTNKQTYHLQADLTYTMKDRSRGIRVARQSGHMQVCSRQMMLLSLFLSLSHTHTHRQTDLTYTMEDRSRSIMVARQSGHTQVLQQADDALLSLSHTHTHTHTHRYTDIQADLTYTMKDRSRSVRVARQSGHTQVLQQADDALLSLSPSLSLSHTHTHTHKQTYKETSLTP